MKLKYILPSFIAAMTMLVGCSDDNDPTYLSELQVSSSYVAIDQDGGSNVITVKATADWEFEKIFQIIHDTDTTYEAAPEWLTLSQVSGGAGETQITFSADATLDGRSTELLISCAGKTQRINVIQGLSTVSDATCAEVIAGPDSKSYRVTGVVTRIVNTVYGNWYLADETGEIYIYGTLDKDGKNGQNNSIDAWGIEVGDVITVEGPKTTYNETTVELVDVAVIDIKKSLVKIEEGETNSLTADGGEFTVRLKLAGDGPAISIDENAQEWLGITSIVKADTTTNISFRVAKNESEEARMATIFFTSTSGSNSSTVSAIVSQMGLSGTLTNPFSVQQAIAYCEMLSGTSTDDFYVKGIISKIEPNGEFGSYGNATFCISDDGEYKGTINEKNKLAPDTSHDFEAYRVLYLGNQPWAEGNAQISEGDEVIIYGKLTLYNGIPETSQGNAYIYSINGVTSDENGLGSLASPFNIAGAFQFIDNGGTSNVYVKGKVSKVDSEFGDEYGNGTFWLSDDGAFNDDLTKDFEAYRVLWLGNNKWVAGNDQIAVGDDVILYGKLTKYVNASKGTTTYETSQGKAYVYSVNGKTE